MEADKNSKEAFQPRLSEPSPDLAKYERQLSPFKKHLHQRLSILRLLAWHAVLAFSSLGKRLTDIFLAMFLVALFSPILLLLFIITLPKERSGPLLYYGKDGKAFAMHHFSTQNLRFFNHGFLNKLPMLFNILRGDLSFVGPGPVPYPSPDTPEYVRQASRPGLTNPYLLRKAVNIAHERETTADREYIHLRSARGDLGILLRSLLILPGSGEKITPPPVIDMLDIKIRNMTLSDAVDKIAYHAKGTEPVQLAFVNPDCMNTACHNKEYKSLLQKLDFVLADGIGIHLACKLMKTSMADNVNGTDLFPYLCARAEQDNIPFYFLGGKPGIVEAMVDRLHMKYPGLMVAGFRHGYFKPEEEAEVIQNIHDSGARILLVAFGAPRQELWIHKHLKALGVSVAIGVGGLFDFMSGQIKRAPRWMREMGLEWTFRLLQEPGRMWRRYIIGNPLFLWRIMRWQRRMRGK